METIVRQNNIYSFRKEALIEEIVSLSDTYHIVSISHMDLDHMTEKMLSKILFDTKREVMRKTKNFV